MTSIERKNDAVDCGERQKFDGKSEECKRRNCFGNERKTTPKDPLNHFSSCMLNYLEYFYESLGFGKWVFRIQIVAEHEMEISRFE